MCQICFKNNHQTKDCYYKDMNTKNLRNVENGSVKSASPSEIEDKGIPLDVIQESEENDSYDDVYILNSTKRSAKKIIKKKKNIRRMSSIGQTMFPAMVRNQESH